MFFLLSFFPSRGSTLFQLSNNPSAYTKLSCFLPWIAQQYDLYFNASDETDPACFEGTGDIEDVTEVDNKECRSSPSSFNAIPEQYQISSTELPCLLPFYLDGQKFDTCIQLGNIYSISETAE